ncbi:MAG: cell division protein FtsZ, partial [Pseudomonadota bacterium]
ILRAISAITGVLTVGVVTKPFLFEGTRRMRAAEAGIADLQEHVDTLIVIPNQNLFRLANEKTTFTEAFSMADDVLYQGVKGVTDLMVKPGLINLDFADVRSVMDEMGKAMMGTGEAEGEDRAVQAAEKAIANPLLDEISLRGARGVLINITGGYDLTLFELDEAANRIREEVDQDANIIVGSTLDTTMDGKMRVSVVATGIDASEVHTEVPIPRRSLAQPIAAAPAVEAAAEVEAPVAAEATAEPVAEVAAAPTPDLFESTRPAAAPAAADDLPPPAYQPTPPAFEPHIEEEAPAAAFVAPRSPAPGTPSPEALQRLQSAVNRVPAGQAPVARPAAAGPAPTTVQPAPAASEERPRFGINSLIGRMTGAPSGETAEPQPMRAQPPVQSYEEEPQADPEQERIEIPAFLRRQAN